MWALTPAPGELYVLTLQRAPAGPLAVLYRAIAGELRVEHEWPENDIGAAQVVDLDGDGHGELLVGTGPYSRHVLALRHGPAGWTHEEYYPDLGRGLSDVIAMEVMDLDGNQQPEVVLGVGPWRAYDVRVLQPTPDGLR